MSGVIPSGWGWEYVFAAYAVTALVFVAYGASVVLRYKRERRRERKA